jgi:hypothetical protein
MSAYHTSSLRALGMVLHADRFISFSHQFLSSQVPAPSPEALEVELELFSVQQDQIICIILMKMMARLHGGVPIGLAITVVRPLGFAHK